MFVHMCSCLQPDYERPDSGRLYKHLLVYLLYCKLLVIAHIVYVYKVTRVVLLWVNDHFSDFEMNTSMSEFLEDFERMLDQEVCYLYKYMKCPKCGV